MSGECTACGSRALVPHLAVRRDEGARLIPTTDRYGAAPDDILRCEACGHGQVASLPMDALLEDAYAAVSDDAYLAEEDGQRATARTALETIERHVAVGTLCDLGCWVGFLLLEARRRGWDAWGVEPSRYASEVARERHGLRVENATLDGADLPKGHFSAVVLADVIEHLSRPAEALDRVRALLAPGGVLYLALPDAGSRVARRLGSRWWSVLPTHVHYFTRVSMARLLERKGFRVAEIGTAPKAFTARYYAERLRGYSPLLADAAGAGLRAVGLSERLVRPDFRDRMAVVAVPQGSRQ